MRLHLSKNVWSSTSADAQNKACIIIHRPGSLVARKGAPQDDKNGGCVTNNTFVILSAVKDLNSRCSGKGQLLAHKAIPAPHSNRKFASPLAGVIEN
ncbi:hypothetical protein DHB64_14180 [Antarcticibacterium sp. W02-3]|nr:hypothetical protein [Antarcticibacterium sp. W02-3]